MECNDSTIREVELLFEDEPGVGGASASQPAPMPASGVPRFSQSATSSAGAPSSVDDPIRARRRVFRRYRPADTVDDRARASFEYSDEGEVRPRSVVMSTGRLSAPLLFGAVGAAGLLGIGAAGVAGAWAVPGVTALLTGVSVTVSSAAMVVTTLFSSFGTLGVGFASLFAMRALGGRSRGFALFLSLWSAWMLTGVVSLVAFGTVPYVSVPVAFLAALAAGTTAVVGSRRRIAAVVGGGATVAVADR